MSFDLVDGKMASLAGWCGTKICNKCDHDLLYSSSEGIDMMIIDQ